jgi:hypothetical protein
MDLNARNIPKTVPINLQKIDDFYFILNMVYNGA